MIGLGWAMSLAGQPGLWETVCMSEKRTKADKAQRQANQLEKKARHPAPKKKKAAASVKPLFGS
jgi:hypothetical protein